MVQGVRLWAKQQGRTQNQSQNASGDMPSQKMGLALTALLDNMQAIVDTCHMAGQGEATWTCLTNPHFNRA
jgi:hypothetical protein